MLELSKLNVCFGDNIIYKNASFKAYPNELTVVMGKSGSGKSTLHDIITFQSHHDCVYEYNNLSLHSFSFEHQREFVKEKMGIVNQSPSFINDLKIIDHIGLCQTLLNGYEVEEYVRILEIEDILDKYPLQLSGGEKMRASILLALIKQPEILVFDEPTSSLDQHHTELIVDLLSQYAHNGHTVIIFSHDRFMKDKADCFYRIENQSLKLIKHEKVESVELLQVNRKKENKHYKHFIYKMLEHKKYFKMMMLVIVSFAIGLSSFSFFYGQSFIEEYNQRLDKTLKAGVIYRETQTSISPLHNSEEVIGKEDLDVIKSLGEIDALQPFISSWITNRDYSDEKYMLFQNKELIAERLVNENQSQSRIGTYVDDDKHSIDLMDYNIDVDEGIYINGNFLYQIVYGFDKFAYFYQEEAKELYESIDENTVLEVPILIPKYVVRDKDGNFKEIVYYEKKVQTKIKGIYCTSIHSLNYIGDDDLFYDFYYPLELQQQIEKEIFEESGREVKRVETDYYFPYEPQYYSFVVKDEYSMSEAKEAIEELGYKVVSHYNDIETQTALIQNLNEGLILISSLVLVVVMMLFIGVKYNQKKEYRDFIHFFKNLGFSYKKGQKYLMNYFVYEACICAILSVILIYSIMYLFFKLQILSFMTLDIKFIILDLILVGIIEIGIPLFITGRDQA